MRLIVMCDLLLNNITLRKIKITHCCTAPCYRSGQTAISVGTLTMTMTMESGKPRRG